MLRVTERNRPWWILVGLAITGAVLAWAFVQSVPSAAAASGTGEAEHHQHHRRFHF
jgi:H+/Cl- antiporter ClcA